mmetsp:Transcript_2890/g.6726  ORF Transcript_2890/g.6726 Transcript_2890/m.6726 type:complete len:289 (-) Transcript_2890:71-937(-)
MGNTCCSPPRSDLAASAAPKNATSTPQERGVNVTTSHNIGPNEVLPAASAPLEPTSPGTPGNPHRVFSDDDDEDDDEDDNVPLSDLIPQLTPRRSRKKPNYKEVDSDDDEGYEDEDDDGGSTRKKRKTMTSASKSAQIAVASTAAEETEKHALVANILKRWQYCLPYWPDMSNVPKPPKTFIETGTKGVYVGIAPDNLGEIRDLRPRDGKAPIFSVLIKYPVKELREDLINGITKQQKALDDNKSRYPEDWYNKVTKLLKTELRNAKAIKHIKVEAEFIGWSKKNKLS